MGLEGGAESGLVFTPPETGTAYDDGYLTASEVTRLNLNADWVLLSACNTGLVTDRKPTGKEVKTDSAQKVAQTPDGLSSLAQSFFYAGSRNLLVSQWEVNDAAGSQIVSELFDEQQARSKSQRLQQAMLHVIDGGLEDNACSQQQLNDSLGDRLRCRIREKLDQVKGGTTSWSHPIYWAPFVIVGDGA